MQQAQLLRRRMAVMNTRTIAPSAITSSSMQSGGSGGSNSNSSSGGNGNVGGGGGGGSMAGGSGGMSPSSVASPVSQIGGMNSPHQPGIGLKPGTQTPPANVLQVVKQVSYYHVYCFFCGDFSIKNFVFIIGARRSSSPTSSSWRWFWKGYTNRCSNATANYATYYGSYGWII